MTFEPTHAIRDSWFAESPPTVLTDASMKTSNLHNLDTHRTSWRKAIEAMQTACPEDLAYWEHELRAFDQTMDSVDAAKSLFEDLRFVQRVLETSVVHRDREKAIQILTRLRGNPIDYASAPVGTRAPAFTGGQWYRTTAGWKWNGPDGIGEVVTQPGPRWTGELLLPIDEASEPPFAKLRAAAVAVGPETWTAVRTTVRTDDSGVFVASTATSVPTALELARAEFIASTDPAAVMVLLRRLCELENLLEARNAN